MQSTLASYVKGLYEGDSAEELLKRSTEVLLGVDREASDALKLLSIQSVFDLASSHLFASSHQLALESQGKFSVYDHVGAIPADVVDGGSVSTAPSDIARSSIKVLRGIGTDNHEAVARALGVTTVRDLGRWPPYHAARHILNFAYSIDGDLVRDPDAPEELVPVARRYATESFRYRRVYFDQVEADAGMELRELNSSDPLDIRSLRLGSSNRLAPATGALLEFEQSWKPQGLSLGQLLSSVALAPGESTKIAVIDWSRRAATAASEDIQAQDRIQAEISQERSTSEIQKLAAREMASGSSTQTTSSLSEAGGYSDGGGLAGLFGGGSVNESFGYTEGETVTVASSGGTRNLRAKMSQEIQERTRQASTAVRSRRAALVTEATTSESEEIRTRILTNYNHSHALTIQYYEVVQIYRTEVRLSQADRALFVPITTIDFRDPAVVGQFKHVLMASISDPAIRRSLSKFINDVQLTELHSFRAQAMNYQVDGELFLKSAALKASAQIRGDVTLIVETREGEKFELEFASGRGARTLEMPLAMTDLASISVEYQSYRGDPVQTVDVWLAVAERDSMAGLKGYHFRCGLMGSSSAGSSEPERTEQRIVSAFIEGMDPNTIDYLQEHALPLSQAIWASLNQQQLATILGGYEFRGAPLLEVIDVNPITFFGNYLVFRHYPKDSEGVDAWNAWQERYLNTETSGAGEELIPVPSDGLFAEAVLGRFNASEKIDMTRFWDWQESPIPMQAPDIGPIVAGNHVAGAAPTPGQIGGSIIGMQMPSALPSPTGLAPIIAAAQSDLFRDLSGLEQTANTLRSSLGESSSLAENAGKLANEIEAIKQKTIGKLAEIATQAGMAAAGVPPGAAGLGVLGGASSAGSGGQSVGRSIGGQLVSGPAAGMSNTTRGGLLNESLKLDENLMRMPDLNWPAPGAKGSHTDTTIGSTRGFEPVAAGNPAPPTETMQSQSNPDSTKRLEERRESLDAPFLVEAIETGDTIGGGTEPLMMWLVYDFGIGNSDPGYDGNSKGPFAVREALTERMKHLVDDLNLWVDLEVYGYTDNYGSDEQNRKLREDRAIAALDWFVPSLQDRRSDWIDSITGEVIPAPINVTMIKGQPLDQYIAENSTPSGRARNRSILIVEKRVHGVKPPEDYWAMPDEQETKKQEVKEKVTEIEDSEHVQDRYTVIAYETWINPHADMRAMDYERFIDMVPVVSSMPEGEKIDFFRFTVDYRHELDAMLRSATVHPVEIVSKLNDIYREIDRVEAEMVNYRMFDRGGLNPDSWIKQFDQWLRQQMKTPNTLFSAYAAEFPEP